MRPSVVVPGSRFSQGVGPEFPVRDALELTDEGQGFDPYEVPNPADDVNRHRTSGRGLFLMRVYMTWIRFNKRGNRVTLCKRRA